MITSFFLLFFIRPGFRTAAVFSVELSVSFPAGITYERICRYQQLQHICVHISIHEKPRRGFFPSQNGEKSAVSEA